MAYPVLELLGLIPKRSGNRPLIIALDGGSGSGKSTLAMEWAEADQTASVVALDDFYLPVNDETLASRGPQRDFEECFDLARIESHALRPLVEHGKASYQKLDWATNTLGEWKTLEPQGHVLIEGVYSHRPVWAKYVDLRIWIETPRAIRRARMAARGYISDKQMDCWQNAEQWYMDTFRPMEKADFVIDGVTGLCWL